MPGNLNKPIDAIYERQAENGGRIVAEGDGRAYRISHLSKYSLTLTRETPKVKGKAARKAEKRARQERRR